MKIEFDEIFHWGIMGGCSAMFLFLMFGLYCVIHGVGDGPIRITSNNGRNSTTYRTKAYKRTGDCISFLCDSDSTTLCGSYTIHK